MPKLEMNLVDYLRVIRKRKRIIIFSFILVLLSTIFYTRRQTPIYSASCKVKIEQRKSVAEILTELVTWSPGDEMASQANLITSYQVMEKVAEKLNVVNQGMSDEERMERVKGLQVQVSTEQISNTNIIAITATSSNREQVRDLVNTVAEIYAETHLENKKKEALNVKKFVEDQLNNYFLELQANENALQEFRRQNPLVVERDITNGPPLQADGRISSLKSEIVKLELELISLKSKYTDAYPEVITVNRKLTKAKQDLSEAVDQFSEEQKDLSGKEIKLAQLKRNVTTSEEIYMMFRKRFHEASILEAEKARDVTIVERATVPSSPIRPNVNFNILIGIFSGLLIGLVLAFVNESFDTSIGRIEDIESLLKVPVLGIIPSTSLEKRRKRLRLRVKKRESTSEKGPYYERLAVLFDPNSAVAEAYRTLRTNLDLTGLKKTGNCIVITSAAPEEGKTQTLCNLAIAMAQAGQKVLIVGSDFRKPKVCKIFGLPRSPGLSEVIIGKIPWRKAINTATDMLLGGKLEYEQILRAQGIENLHILTAGERAPNPAELLSFSEMDNLIQELRQNYDVILFDTPPTLPVTDSAILGAKADGVVLVYQAGKISRYALMRAKAQLENVKVKILGVIINNLKARFIEDVTPYQKYRYYGYYGEKK